MKNIHPILITILVAFCTFQTNAQSFLTTDGHNIVNEEGETFILRGMGLGGWMVQEGYMLQTASFANPQHKIREKITDLIGEANTEEFYDAWLENNVQKVDVDSLKSWGFNSIRLPMHYNLFTLPIEEEPVAGENTWLDKGFELTDSIVSWCAQNEMYVVLDLHAAPGGQGGDAAISDYDETKPSLWESNENKAKMVALWGMLAERYADEKWIGGYDLLNETNWPLASGVMRDLYIQCTDAIREHDNNHIIFIEGNWWANDFTGLTPPWDDKLVYSPHKYWSINDQASIQWVLDLQEEHNVPLYLGESGENSNVWFRDAIKLLEDHGIGWAWWPMKKVDNIAGPLSVTKNSGYAQLLNYWSNGGTQPSVTFAKEALMELAEDYRMENCRYQPDVIDAMFRQVVSDETKPYNTQSIPGVVYATDYDMGRNGQAYFDIDLANYHVSTGNYTAWNKGWAYRNDGVDIEPCQDNVNTNGFNVGWIDEGEWMQYDIDVEESAIYDIEIRFATAGFDGSFRLNADGSDLTGTRYVANTGGYQSWGTVTVPDVILTPADQKFRFYSEGSDYNMSSFNFIQKAATTSIPAEFLSAHTVDENTVQLNINKPLTATIPSSTDDFQLFVGGLEIPITGMTLDANNTRVITFEVDYTFVFGDIINMTYTGNEIDAEDGTNLETYDYEQVENRLAIVSQVPGRVEAEDFYFQSGIVLENTFDNGGGKNIGFIDNGDYADYYINVTQQGTYAVNFRTASLDQTGELQLQLVDESGGTTVLQTVSFAPTGGWQTWTTTEGANAYLTEGRQHMRLFFTGSGFNMNYLEFDFLQNTDEVPAITNLSVYPNPNDGYFAISGGLLETQDVRINVFDVLGRKVYTEEIEKVDNLNRTLDLQDLAKGSYYLTIQAENGFSRTEKILIFE